MEKIFKRTVMDEVNKFIDSDDIIVFHGARQVGKTWAEVSGLEM
jgi:predicted AAA+ superfamily ATPase